MHALWAAVPPDIRTAIIAAFASLFTALSMFAAALITARVNWRLGRRGQDQAAQQNALTADQQRNKDLQAENDSLRRSEHDLRKEIADLWGVNRDLRNGIDAQKKDWDAERQSLLETVRALKERLTVTALERNLACEGQAQAEGGLQVAQKMLEEIKEEIKPQLALAPPPVTP